MSSVGDLAFKIMQKLDTILHQLKQKGYPVLLENVASHFASQIDNLHGWHESFKAFGMSTFEYWLKHAEFLEERFLLLLATISRHAQNSESAS